MANFFEMKITVNVPREIWKEIPEVDLTAISEILSDDAQIELAVATIKERLREIIPAGWQPQITGE